MHLHLHTNYSILDGRGLIEDYVKLAIKDKQQALAVTDHGTLGGIIEAYTTCKNYGLKFIAGCELYVDVTELREKNYPGHLTVLAKNENGYRALIAANNLGHRQFYYRPRITLQQVIEHNFAQDWIILSGCMSSPLYDCSFSESLELVKQLASHSAGFFLEFMWHGGDDEQFQAKQWEYLEKAAALHKATQIPMVITNDCHYAEKYQEDTHRRLLQQSREPREMEFDGEGYHFKTMAQMEVIASDLGVPSAVDNAVAIGKQCDLVIPEADHTNWYVPDITGGHPKETIEELCLKKLWEIENYTPYGKEYWDRYNYELSVLSSSPAILNSYLVTADVVNWCHDRNISIAARGSMAGSLVSYLLGITLEDPIKYGLSFSRAVNPARPTIPDFDLDVSSIHRSEVLDYLKERYKGNIPIAAYTHYGPRGALRKILRMEDLRSYPEINELSKQLPHDWVGDDFSYSPTQHRYVGNHAWVEDVPEPYREFVAIYQGLYSNVTVHPSGVLISGPERELENEVPLQWVASSKTLCSAFDMYTLKKIGLFKLDVLGLRTLDQLAYMEQVSNEKIPDDNYDEPAVLAAFGADLLAEIFQMDGYACREVIKLIGGIVSFEDIVAANTLARPGASEFTSFYRSGYESLIREYPQLQDTLGPTNGLILYQEQVMDISRVLADFDDSEQDDIKESIKYFNHANWVNSIEPKFRDRCLGKGIDPAHILEAISRMASYTYNRAHAMTYAAIAYKMMWYKVHHPAVYYAAVYDGAEDKQRLVLESHFFKVKWHPPDVNLSQEETIITNNEIILGLAAIKGVGPAAFEAISQARPFSSLEDMENRVKKRKCSVKVIGKLKSSFACASLGIDGSLSEFKENFGFDYCYMNGELVNEISRWEAPGQLAGFITELREITVRKEGPNKGKTMAQLSIMNNKGRRRGVIFPDIWQKAKGKLYSGAAVKFTGQGQVSGDFIIEHAEMIG